MSYQVADKAEADRSSSRTGAVSFHRGLSHSERRREAPQSRNRDHPDRGPLPGKSRFLSAHSVTRAGTIDAIIEEKADDNLYLRTTAQSWQSSPEWVRPKAALLRRTRRCPTRKRLRASSTSSIRWTYQQPPIVGTDLCGGDRLPPHPPAGRDWKSCTPVRSSDGGGSPFCAS